MLVASLFTIAAFAEKPEWSGKGKPSAEQVDMHRAAMEAKEDARESMDKHKDKHMNADAGRAMHEGKEKAREGMDKDMDEGKKKMEKVQGLEKQGEKKADQVQKELGRGSEQGQESRKSQKKWWKFCGDETSE